MNRTQRTQKNARSGFLRPNALRSARSLTFLAVTSVFAMAPVAVDAAPQRTILQERDLLSGHPQTARLGTLTLKAGDAIPWHVHEGVEMAYVMTGRIIVSIAGKEDAIAAQGSSIQFPPGIAHRVRAPDDSDASCVIAWVTDTGTPLLTPAPAPAPH